MRMYYYATILVGIIILFTMGGIELPVSGGLARTFNIVSGGVGEEANLTLQNFKNSEMWSNDNATDSIPGLTYILLGLASAGFVIGIFGRAPDISYIKAGIVFVFASFLLADIIALWSKLNSYGITWISWGTGAILGILLVGFFVTTLEWWTGND